MDCLLEFASFFRLPMVWTMSILEQDIVVFWSFFSNHAALELLFLALGLDLIPMWPLASVVKFSTILGLYPGVASSLVSRGFLGTLPGDSSWKTEEGSFHSRHLEGLTGEARPVSGHWSVVSIRWLCSEPTCPEYSPVFTTFSPIKF